MIPADIHSTWFISPRECKAIQDRSGEIKGLLEQVVQVIGPDFHAETPLSSLQSDSTFSLLYIKGFCQHALSPIRPGQVIVRGGRRAGTPPKPSAGGPVVVHHTLKCFLGFYTTRSGRHLDADGPADVPQEHMQDIRDHVDRLGNRLSQPGLANPCNGHCLDAFKDLSPLQRDGLVYMCNLLTGYALACMVGSTKVEEHLEGEIQKAWPRVQGVLARDVDDQSTPTPDVVSADELGDGGKFLARL